MTNRELLELAAKAARIEVTDSMRDLWEFEGLSAWNPLTDDGDALRLAVKLKLRVDSYDDQVETMDGCNTYQIGKENFTNTFVKIESLGDVADPYAATRRAIVRAAAEIGKGMV